MVEVTERGPTQVKVIQMKCVVVDPMVPERAVPCVVIAVSNCSYSSLFLSLKISLIT